MLYVIVCVPWIYTGNIKTTKVWLFSWVPQKTCDKYVNSVRMFSWIMLHTHFPIVRSQGTKSINLYLGLILFLFFYHSICLFNVLHPPHLRHSWVSFVPGQLVSVDPLISYRYCPLRTVDFKFVPSRTSGSPSTFICNGYERRVLVSSFLVLPRIRVLTQRMGNF